LPAIYQAVEALEHPVFRDYLKLSLFTGLRREKEAASLTWKEMIDFTNRVIRVPPSSTKNQEPLHLPMSSFVRDLLVARRSLGDSHWVFPSGRRGHIGDPTPHFEAIAEACGVRVSCHDLRRTYVTIAESIEMSNFALKALVNHTLGSDVTGGYIQMSVARLRKPAQRVCDRLLELIGLAGPEAVDNVARLGQRICCGIQRPKIICVQARKTQM
jgi:integrase